VNANAQAGFAIEDTLGHGTVLDGVRTAGTATPAAAGEDHRRERSRLLPHHRLRVADRAS